MTKEEKQKAIDTLKISAPIMAITQEEFYDYIQTLNKIMDWLEQETVSKESYDHEYFLRKEIEIKIAKIEQKEPKWIPVSERLPNLDDFTGSMVWQKKVLITGYMSFDDKKELFVSEAFAKDVICNSIHDTIVVAWMPLPKPYKEEE